MSDPKRLIDSLDDELGRSLLMAASTEQPRGLAVQRTLTALGVGAAAAVTVSEAAAAIGATTSASAAGITASAAAGVGAVGEVGAVGTTVALGAGGLAAGAGASAAGIATGGAAAATQGAVGLAFLKWVGVGVLSSAAVMGVSQLSNAPVVDPSPKAPHAALSEPAHFGPVPRTGNGALVDAQPKSDVVEQLETSSTVAVPVSAPRMHQPRDAEKTPLASPEDAEGTAELLPTELLEEIQLVDGARASLKSGNATEAMRALRSHSGRFPRGRLLPEVLFLRLQAEVALGQTAAARSTAKLIVGRYPNGPHAGKAREVLTQ